MKKLIFAAFFLCTLCGASWASTISVALDPITFTINTTVSATGLSYTYDLNPTILNPASGLYNPATDLISAASLVFTFTGSGTGSKKYDIKIDSWNSPIHNINSDKMFAFVEVGNPNLSFLRDDGKLTFTMKKNTGTFKLDTATLNVTVDRTTVPVPASLLLLGSGLLGIAGIRKRFSN